MSDFLTLAFKVTPDGTPYVSLGDSKSGFSDYAYDDIRFDTNDTDGKFRIVLDELFCVRCIEVCFCYYNMIGLYRFSDISTGADLERMYDLWYETVIE